MSHSAKFLPGGGTFVVCCLALTGALASAQDSKTTVRYPTGHAVSQSLKELPIDVLGLGDVEAPEPKPLPLRSHGVLAPARPDPVLQQEFGPTFPLLKALTSTAQGRWDPPPRTSISPSDPATLCRL